MSNICTLMNNKILQTHALYQILDLESFILITLFGFSTYLFYRFFLRNVTEVRHKNIQGHLKNLMQHFMILSIVYCLYSLFSSSAVDYKTAARLLPYMGLLSFIWGAIVFVKSSRLLVLEYLFLGSMRAGVPLLLVNIFSLILSIAIAFWAVNILFGLELTPLIATSAAFSIILGLALQDTLGNLFAGISLQLDKTFEIGDWLEVMNGSSKIVGQVKELSWRSTALIGLSDESITLPNKLMAQSQVSNFSPDGHPIVRSQTFRLPYGCDYQKACTLLESAASQISDVKGIPSPFAFISETTEQGTLIKLIYFIEDYGRQYSIGDKVQKKGLEILLQNNFPTYRPSYQVNYQSVSEFSNQA